MANANPFQGYSPDDIYTTLVKEIDTFVLMPGHAISENKLAERFETSRTSVRVALQRLEGDNRVAVVPQRGTYITYLDYEYVRSVLYIRYQVEYSAMCEVVNVMNKKAEEELKDIIEEYARIPIDSDKSFERNDRFHRYLYRMVDKDEVWNIIKQLDAGIRRYRQLTYKYVIVRASTFEEKHFELIDSLKRGDKNQLSEVVKEHVMGHINTLQNMIGTEWSNYFGA